MPSGRTHDSITLWSLPIVAATTFGLTQSGNLTLLVSGGFLFAGLMFGPDLDIYSQQYKRWGVLRWIWLPYRRSLKHRSIFSHGAIIGTIGRIFYLSIWLALFAIVAIVSGAIAQQLLGNTVNWQATAQSSVIATFGQTIQLIQRASIECLALTIGLELGAMSHSLSDWVGSTIKRWNKRRKR
ncbi:metal-binding protein [Cyanobacteria bacterium FACHB-63]|nr:metal-binding protein [Cyanobacteria bacterium FACHB-63]